MAEGAVTSAPWSASTRVFVCGVCCADIITPNVSIMDQMWILIIGNWKLNKLAKLSNKVWRILFHFKKFFPSLAVSFNIHQNKKSTIYQSKTINMKIIPNGPGQSPSGVVLWGDLKWCRETTQPLLLFKPKKTQNSTTLCYYFQNYQQTSKLT